MTPIRTTTSLRHELRCGPILVRELDYAGGTHFPRHAHAETQVTLLLGGAMRESVGRREAEGTALSVVVKPAGVEHLDRLAPEGAGTLQIQLDAGHEPDIREWRLPLQHWQWVHGGAVAGLFLAVVRSLRDPALRACVESHVTDALAGLPVPGPEPPAWRTPPRWLSLTRE